MSSLLTKRPVKEEKLLVHSERLLIYIEKQEIMGVFKSVIVPVYLRVVMGADFHDSHARVACVAGVIERRAREASKNEGGLAIPV